MVGKFGEAPVIRAKFLLERETKGTWRYREADDVGNMLGVNAGKIGVIYLRKTVFGSRPPLAIEVEICGSES
jgi:hypothetical protein